ncbi:protoporphyrinogen oxidase [Streptomyces sp. 3MP-14]|uniref:Coproporphyrinogen III oxidase n=1 Tax=Streptomyces mimosae TaxID=2586635 RepID=A0A5N6AG56_9ACTN|nr:MULTISPECIES: protoporphyrinogen oxidase [Streptomyces]KAB8167837.1 protoporphyrinogen oxidase [Streptomyces mimosae]KAB8177515.1 protoporphyrinogen oxidase [Streptomyces sp. 3MP-14]
MHVIVVGGGISGLAAAHRLLAAGLRVTVLESNRRLGGKLHTGHVAGVQVDLGAESLLARRPEATELARAVGLGDALRPPAVTSAAIWTRGELRPMPQGQVMGVPDSAAALAGVLSDSGLARIARDAELPPLAVHEDVGIGQLVAERMGNEVADRLVDPLLGGVYAGDAYRISLRSAVPKLYEAVRKHDSLLAAVRSLRPEPSAAGARTPVFTGIEGGVGTLAAAVAEDVAGRGAVIETGVAVTGLRRTARGWVAALDDGRSLAADGVLLAVPAPAAARLLAAEAPAAAGELGSVEYASMAIVTLAFRRSELATLPRGSGFLVPAVEGRTIKAATFTSGKWDWAAAADPELFVLRVSVGRFGEEGALEWDDADLVRVALDDLGEAAGLRATPVDSVVTRWWQGLPQYTVGHDARVARVRGYLAGLPGLGLCGAAYDGVGVPACIGGAEQAAAELLRTLPTGPHGEAGE